MAARQPSEHAELEIEAEEKKGKSELTLSISWHTALELSLEEAPKISAELPHEPPARGGRGAGRVSRMQ